MVKINNFSHPKCYANKLNNCSEKISREHYISNNLLGELEHNKTVKIAGLAWIDEKEFKLMSRASLGSNILCTKHNSQLSSLDAEIKKLYQTIIDFDKDFNSQTPMLALKTINGNLIEKWMLKTLVGMIVSKQIINKATGKPITKVAETYIEILFNNHKFPETWGLYFPKPQSEIIHKFDSISFMPMIGNDEVKAAGFLICNFKFYLVIGKPDNLDFWGFYRVKEIVFSERSTEKILKFEWDETNQGVSINLTRSRTTNDFPDEWEEWTKK